MRGTEGPPTPQGPDCEIDREMQISTKAALRQMKHLVR